MRPEYHQFIILLYFVAKGAASAVRSGPDNTVPLMRSVNPMKNDLLHRMAREAGKPPLTNVKNSTNITNVEENLKITFAKQNLSIIEKNDTNNGLNLGIETNFTKHGVNVGFNLTKLPL